MLLTIDKEYMDSQRRRFLQATAAVGTIAIAGCSSNSDDGDGDGGGGGDDGGGDDGGGSGGDDSGGDGSDGTSGDVDIAASNEQFNHFEFEEGERYEYEVFMEDEGEGTFVWEVNDISGNQMTIHSVYDVGDTYHETTVTGDEGTIQGQIMVSPAAAFMSVALFSPTWSQYQQGNLEVGNRWEASSPEGSVVMEVVDKDVYAGVECFASELHNDDVLVHESCVNPQLGIGAYSAFYDNDGSLNLEMELVDYRPPN